MRDYAYAYAICVYMSHFKADANSHSYVAYCLIFAAVASSRMSCMLMDCQSQVWVPLTLLWLS